MHAFLFTGSTKTGRLEEIDMLCTKLKISRHDQILIEPEVNSIGIAQVRTLEQRLLLKPYHSSSTAAIIHDAHSLTVEAQQALLKTLEEPPIHSLIFLETDNPSLLLPTIISRCQLKHLAVHARYTQKEIDSCLDTLKQLSTLSIGNRAKLIETIAGSRDRAKQWVDLALYTTHRTLLAQHRIHQSSSSAFQHPFAFKSASLVRSLISAQQQLAANVYPTLVLDTVFLSLPSPISEKE